MMMVTNHHCNEISNVLSSYHFRRLGCCILFRSRSIQVETFVVVVVENIALQIDHWNHNQNCEYGHIGFEIIDVFLVQNVLVQPLVMWKNSSIKIQYR